MTTSAPRSRTIPVRAERAYASALGHLRRRDAESAMADCRRALRAAPDYGPALHMMGMLLFDVGDHQGALACLERAERQLPRSAEVQTVKARILAATGRQRDALAHHVRALELAPDSVQVLSQYGEFLRLRGRGREALALFSQALKIDPRHVETLRCAGLALHGLDESDRALSCFQAALAVDPGNALLHVSMGNVYTNRGDRRAAAASYRAALEADPGYVDAHLGLANVEPEAFDAERVEVLRGLDRREMSVHNRMNLHFVLAQGLARNGRDGEAMAAYVVANGLRDQLTGGPFDIEAFARDTETRIEVFDRGFFTERAGWGVASDKPVFIVGMPRSGTTLVESVLGGHPDCHAGGELRLLGEIRLEIERAAGAAGSSRELWRALSEERIVAGAHHYLEGIEALAPDASRVINKMPHNFLNLWLIALMFPDAPVIHCRRDPRDACVSIFTETFTDGHAYKNDLRTLGLYHHRYRMLMEHWARVLPNPPLEVSYEDLVADPEGVSRRIIAHCGLDWDPACLDFHAQRRSVRTASALQVRKKVYGTSVGRWRRYEDHLGPLLEALGPIDDWTPVAQSQPDNAAETRQ